MEKPTAEQIKQIVLNLTESDDPIVHRSTLEKYFTPTAAFQHPIVNVKPAPRSLDHIKQVYAVYKVLLSDIKINFDHITIDADNTRAVVELTEDFNFALLPFRFARVHGLRFLTVLDLAREEGEGGKYYFSRQYGSVSPFRIPFPSSSPSPPSLSASPSPPSFSASPSPLSFSASPFFSIFSSIASIYRPSPPLPFSLPSPSHVPSPYHEDFRTQAKRNARRRTDITPIDSTLKTLPFGFLYSWCRDICTLTGSVVGSALQTAGLWPTA